MAGATTATVMNIRNVSVLRGEGLEYVPRVDVEVVGRRFCRVGRREGRPDARSGGGGGVDGARVREVDGEGLLMIPGLVNCHTHVGDSVGKDVMMEGSVDDRVHPVSGAKQRILSRTDYGHLVSFVRGSCVSMLAKGVTTFVDFREGGREGVDLLREAVGGVPIRAVVLGRPSDRYHDAAQVRANARFRADDGGDAEVGGLLRRCDGLGLSGANENSVAQLGFYRRKAEAAGRLRAIHAAETRESVRWSKRVTGRSEVARALALRPHFLVHMTHATGEDVAMAARRTRGVVVCPRANAALAGGVPDVWEMLRAGCRVAIGTDNVMVNTPDMFREMDYLWKVMMGMRRRRLDPRVVLQMATVNAGRILGRKIGVIGRGMAADAVFLDKHAIDIEPMHSPHAAVVHRASEAAVRAVMVGGVVVHGRI